jgi:hypothetical protein
VRLRDEETWCALAIESFLPWCDELVIVVQSSVDRTREIAERYRGPNVHIYDYPFQTYPSGPGHDNYPANSVYASAYHYNYTLAKSTRSHVVKLDGDMVMMDWAGSEIRSLMAAGHTQVRFFGTDIVGKGLAHIGCHPRCPTDGVFPVTRHTFYKQGALTQKLSRSAGGFAYRILRPAFLHFKWAKPVESAIKRWPEDWRDKEHFRRIWQRRTPVAPYTGEYPESVLALKKSISEENPGA